MKYNILILLFLLQSCFFPLSKNVDIYIRNDYGSSVYIKIEDPDRDRHQTYPTLGYIDYTDKELQNNFFMLYSDFDYNKKSMSSGIMPVLAPVGVYYSKRYDWMGRDTKIIIYDDNKSNANIIYEYNLKDLHTMPINNDVKDKSYLKENTYFFVLTKEGLKRYTYKTMPPSLDVDTNKKDEIINNVYE